MALPVTTTGATKGPAKPPPAVNTTRKASISKQPPALKAPVKPQTSAPPGDKAPPRRQSATKAKANAARSRAAAGKANAAKSLEEIRVRRVHRRDLNRVWEFLKITFRDVNKDTVEYQRPRTKARFMEIYDDEGVAQLVFETSKTNEIVGYAECAFEVAGADNWINARYFEKRDMRPMFVDELAVHPRYQGRGVGSFVLDQLEHLARVRGCTHLVLEVAKNNSRALHFYRKRNFFELDAAIFLAMKVPVDAELLPPRPLRSKPQA